MSMLQVSWHGNHEKKEEIRAYSHEGRKDYAVLAFGPDVRIYLSEDQLRDLAAKIEAELQDRMAETIKLAAGNPQLIADLKKNWVGAKSPEEQARIETEWKAYHPAENWKPQDAHARANADQVELLERETKNA